MECDTSGAMVGEFFGCLWSDTGEEMDIFIGMKGGDVFWRSTLGSLKKRIEDENNKRE